jgi:hypothetical protein
MRLLLWFSLLRISSDFHLSLTGAGRRVCTASLALRLRWSRSRAGGAGRALECLIRRQSVCHSKTKRKYLFPIGFSAPQRSFSHSFRRSGETEMEQLFQMATERSDAKPDRADLLRIGHCGIVTPHGSSPTGISFVTLSEAVSITLTLFERPFAT